MTESPEREIQLWLEMNLTRAGRGSRSRLAAALGVRPDAITRMLNTDPEKEPRRITANELQAMVRFFGVPAPELEPLHRMVPIMGKAGAGPDGSVLYASSQGQFGEIQAPDDEETIAALEVTGNSMYGLANDGWLIFYEDPMPPSEYHIGEMCVCWLGDGRVVVKFPHPSQNAGFWHLESANAPMMRDVVIEKMALVTDIKTRRAAQRYIRRNPEENIPTLSVRKA